MSKKFASHSSKRETNSHKIPLWIFSPAYAIFALARDMSQLILHILSGDVWGGAEAQIELQLGALRKLGTNVQALLFNCLTTLERFERAQIPCTVIEEKQGALRLCIAAHKLLAAAPPQLIITHGYKETVLGCLLARHFRCPLIVTFHGYSDSYLGLARVKMAFYLKLQRFIARYWSARVVTVTHALAQQLGFSSLPNLHVIHNVVEQKQNSQIAAAVLHHPAILMVGRLVRVKRVHLAIQALSYLPERIELYLIGDGPERESLITLAKQLGLAKRVHFLGFIDDVFAVLYEANMLLLTSESEGLPTVVLEAILTGTPVLSSRLPGVEEAFTALEGYPISYLSSDIPEEIAQDIERAGSALKRISPEHGRRLIAQFFSPAGAAKKHIEIYQQLLSA